jgi:hypothetical protein
MSPARVLRRNAPPAAHQPGRGRCRTHGRADAPTGPCTTAQPRCRTAPTAPPSSFLRSRSAGLNRRQSIRFPPSYVTANITHAARLHASELCGATPRTLVAFLPEATRCADVIVAEQNAQKDATARCATIRACLPSWPMKAIRRDPRSHYISMMRDRCVVNMSGVCEGGPSPSRSDSSRPQPRGASSPFQTGLIEPPCPSEPAGCLMRRGAVKVPPRLPLASALGQELDRRRRSRSRA